jgi:hypothetical protein
MLSPRLGEGHGVDRPGVPNRVRVAGSQDGSNVPGSLGFVQDRHRDVFE